MSILASLGAPLELAGASDWQLRHGAAPLVPKGACEWLPLPEPLSSVT